MTVWTAGCNEVKNPNREVSDVLDREGYQDYRPDTQVVFVVREHEQILRVPVWIGREDLPNILELMHKYPTGHADSTRTYTEELTGEGNPEVITERVWFQEDEYRTYFSIFSEGEMIFSDSGTTDLDYFAQVIWEDPDAFMTVYPWSGLYYSQYNFPAYEPELMPFATNETSVGMEMMRRQLDPKDRMARERVSRELQQKLGNFKGKALVLSGTVEAEVYLWDQLKREFVLLYAP
ncbi:MAG: hypothetical protein H6581_17160 [Bacteroidia bacterium]|nr:hypothetical protein [Bacteroidia bacterium]